MEHDALRGPRYALAMLSNWLRDALATRKVSQSELARHLTATLGRSIDRSAVNKMTKGTRNIDGDEIIEIAKFLGVPLPEQGADPIRDQLLSIYDARQGDPDFASDLLEQAQLLDKRARKLEARKDQKPQGDEQS